MRTLRRTLLLACGVLVAGLLAAFLPVAAHAASTAKEIDAKVDAALDRLRAQIPGSQSVLEQAKGVLVFAGVIKAGLVIAGEGGEGALRIGGKTQGYYSIFSGSIGFQAGGQKRDIILVFLDADALKKFQANEGWKVGADGTVTLIDTGATGMIDSATLKQPVIGFVVGQKGLMAGISLDGSKISKLDL
jgi:lipid-binding SYLF domain-containing protein